jgi:hypothetical protein
MAKKKPSAKKKGTKKGSRKASATTKSMAGPKIKRGRTQCASQDRIVIYWDHNSIQVVPDNMHCDVNSSGVCWQSLDHRYRVSFQGGSPFTPPDPPDISAGTPRGSGPPNPGSNRPVPYKYSVRRLGGNYPVLDPTIKVDP